MTWLDFVALTFAASAVVDVWRNGSIFAMARAVLESRADDDHSPNESASSYAGSSGRVSWFWQYLPMFLVRMLNCSFCCSHHTPWMLAVVFFLPALWLTGPWAWLLKLPVYSLAATRLGTIMNAWAPEEAQYNRIDNYSTPFLEPPDDESFDAHYAQSEHPAES
jgi:hypothetical protein